MLPQDDLASLLASLLDTESTPGRRALLGALRGLFSQPTDEQLAEALRDLADDIAELPLPGRPCSDDECDGRLKVLNTRTVGSFRVQYYGCNKCGERPEKNQRSVPHSVANRPADAVVPRGDRRENEEGLILWRGNSDEQRIL